jgi:hypothetical protein
MAEKQQSLGDTTVVSTKVGPILYEAHSGVCSPERNWWTLAGWRMTSPKHMVPSLRNLVESILVISHSHPCMRACLAQRGRADGKVTVVPSVWSETFYQPLCPDIQYDKINESAHTGTISTHGHIVPLEHHAMTRLGACFQPD